jgi:hypothetical protein
VRDLAGRLEMMAELYNKGTLCKCKKKKTIIAYGGDKEVIIRHDQGCQGKKALMRLLEAP